MAVVRSLRACITQLRGSYDTDYGLTLKNMSTARRSTLPWVAEAVRPRLKAGSAAADSARDRAPDAAPAASSRSWLDGASG